MEESPIPAEEAKCDDETTTTPSGRVRRRAAAKAASRLSEAITALKTKADSDEGSDGEDIFGDGEDADEYRATDDINEDELHERFVSRKKDGNRLNFSCKLCQESFQRKKQVQSHLMIKHTDELDPDAFAASGNESEEEGSIFSEASDDSVAPKWKRRKGSSKRAGGSKRGAQLEPTTEFIEMEMRFRARNFGLETFDEFHTVSSDWKALGKEESLAYVPTPETSAKFKSQKDQEGESLERFSSNKSGFLFAGGPVWAAGWCPEEDKEKADGTNKYFALSTLHNMDVESKRDDCQPHKGLLQVWSCDVSGNPSFEYGIAHEFGKSWSLQWAPSGNRRAGDGDNLDRLGILAAAFSDGTVRIFSACLPGQLPDGGGASRIFTVQPKRTLCLSESNCGNQGQCLRVSWYRGPGHRVVAGGFSKGLFALWNILQPEGTLFRESTKIYPYSTVIAHASSITGLDIADSDERFPTQVVTGSWDRKCCVWDLTRSSPVLPVASVRRGGVTDLSLCRNSPLPLVAVSYDEALLTTSAKTLLFDMSLGKTFPAIFHNSTVWSQTHHPWLNILVTGNAAGQAVAFVGGDSNSSMDSICKGKATRKVVLFRAKKDPDGVLTFSDAPLDKLNSIGPEHVPKSFDLSEMEDLEKDDPVASVNRVCFNTDPDSFGTILFGGQSGLGRILKVGSFDTEEARDAMKAAAKKC